MILDEFGRPIAQPSGFITPDWVKREIGRMYRSWIESYKSFNESTKIADLRESAGVSARVVGDVVRVKPPERYR